MLNYTLLDEQGRAAGFSHVAPLRVEAIQLLEDVRDMCRANTCGQYGRNWSCPPGCGSLEDCRGNIAKYREGILVQTVDQLEDEMDGEGMMAAEARHKQTFAAFHEQLLGEYPGLLAIGTGSCTRCGTCTYPHRPCRFPHRKISSMEAYGMLVLQICKDSGLRYYYGPGIIAYTGCFLLA